MSVRSIAATAVIMAAVGAAVGYWYSQQQSAAPSAAPSAAAGPAAAATGARPTGAGGAAGGGTGGPAGAAPAGRPAGPPPVTVESAKVQRVALPQTLSAVGSLLSDESVVLRPEVGGRIVRIGFREGERIAAGTVLFQLDDALPRAELEQALANLALAESQAQRAQELQQQGFISAQARDEAENKLKVAQAAVSLSRARLARTVIRAPFDGVITLRSVSVGDFVREGQDLVGLESVAALKVDFRVPEMLLARVSVGQALQIGIDALPGVQAEGRVYAINPIVDAQGRSVVLRARIENPTDAMRPGMFARLRLLLQEQADSLVVPETALVPEGTNQFVYRIEEGRAQQVRVEIGQRRDGQVEIVSGLAADDEIVTAGQLKLRPGAAVRVVNSAAGAPQS